METAHAAFPQVANAVVIARSDDYPDALAGVPLAYKLQAPLLLTFPHSLPVEVFQSIQNMAPSAIYILGGDAAVSVPVARQLSTIAPITRLYGSDRYETAAAVARQLDNLGSAVIVNGLNYPDAVSVAAAAGRTGVPILLTDKDTLPEVTAKALRTLNITQVTVVGGAGVISDSVLAALPNPTRLAGADRYDTSAAVIRAFPGDGARLYIATGRNFPDALTGGLLAALNNTSILLVDPLGLTPQQRSLLTTLRGKKAVALGGSASVSEEIMSEVRALLAN
jgi:putative cell wall-binding protein